MGKWRSKSYKVNISKVNHKTQSNALIHDAKNRRFSFCCRMGQLEGQ